MVSVRISRQSIEVGALAPATAAVTRQDAEVAALAQDASAGDVRVSRVSVEVLGRKNPTAGVTRVDAEVAALAQDASTGDVRVSRVSIEVGSRVVKRGTVTRLDAEVASLAQEASTGDVRVSRVSIEAAARRGASGAVSPLALADGIEVFLHNWVDEAVLRSAYQTDIATSPETGAESRRSLSVKPERTISFYWHIHACDQAQKARLDRLLVMLRKLTDERIAVPLYMDQRELDIAYDTTDDTVFFQTSKGRFFVGARVVIVQLDFSGSYLSHSFHIIEDMQDDRLVFDAPLGVGVAAGSLVMPMMDCEVTLEAKAKYFSAGSVAVKMELQEVAGPSQLPPVKSDIPSGGQSFQGIPIFDFNPDWLEGIEKGRVRQGQKYRQGLTNRVYTAATRSREWHRLNLSGLRGDCADTPRDDIWNVVEMFDTRRGRARSFWHIDQEHFWEVDSIDPSGNFIGINEIGNFADFEAELEGFWVGVVMTDGTMYVREAATVQQVLTVFRITVNPPLPTNLDIADVVRITRARPSRFDSDEMEERWKHTGYMATTLDIIETLEEETFEV